MSNPDEETAVAQFGTPTSIGVCTMMATARPSMFATARSRLYGKTAWIPALLQRRKARSCTPRAARKGNLPPRRRRLFAGASSSISSTLFPTMAISTKTFAYSNGLGKDIALPYNNCWQLSAA